MNPFSYGTIVTEPYFYNRKEENDRIVRTLKGGNNLVLYAPRRFGKTSLVVKAMKELENAGYFCVYFDFMTVYSRESFIKSYSSALFEKQGNLKRILRLFSEYVKGIKPVLSYGENGKPEISFTFSETSISDDMLGKVLDMPEKLALKSKPYIVIMDEFQDIQKLNGENFENLLRSHIQHHQNVHYLFLGSRTHLLMEMFTRSNRPFYNSASVMGLGPLPKDETIEFLVGRFSKSGIHIDKQTSEYLMHKAGNIPYYIQFLASEIWQSVIDSGKKVDHEIINESFDKVIDLKNDYYFEMYDRLSRYQKKLLHALAQEGRNIFSREYALKYHLSATSTTQKAIHGLIENGLIEKVENEYTFSDPFFRQYILRLPA